MPSVPSPSALKEQLAVTPRRIYALWHREEPPARAVVEKFSRKLKKYDHDKRQRQICWTNFATSATAGEWTMPDPKQDAPGADAYLRRALDNVDDVLVFYTDLLGDPDDAIGRRTGLELEFVFDKRVQAQLRFWFGRVASIDLEVARIGKCALSAVTWLVLPQADQVFSWQDPDGTLDREVGRSFDMLLGIDIGPPGASPGASPGGLPVAAGVGAATAAAPEEAWYQRIWPWGRNR